jgi:PAS domain S-box-containing protein
MLLALAVALIAAVPEHHPTLLLRERTSAGQLGRILLPILILVPLLGVWIRAKGHDEGWFDTGTGRAINSIGLIIAISSIMWVALLHLRRSERALRESEGQFRRMADAAPAMLWVTSNDGSLAFLSRGWFVYTGQTEEEAAGFGWLEAVHPEDRERSGRAFREANEKQEPFEADYRLRRADGVYRWCIDSGRPRRDEASGAFLGFVGSVIDVHERIEAEQQLHRHKDSLEETIRQRTEEMLLAQHRLASAERMASIGTLASGLAHDIDNIILPLGERLDPLLLARNFSEEQRANFVVILALLDHLRLISRNLSLFARDPKEEGIIGSTELSAWWTTVRSLIEASVSGRLGVRSGAAIRLHADVPSGLPPVNLAPHRITQAVLQLAQNSREAILALRAKNPWLPHERGSITIRAQQAPDGRHVLLKVIDDGCGMPPEVRARAIEPFFTTKDRPTTAGAGGSGMGLSLVHSICERAGGSLHIESIPGEGVTITMQLPMAERMTSERAESESTGAVESTGAEAGVGVAGVSGVVGNAQSNSP